MNAIQKLTSDFTAKHNISRLKLDFEDLKAICEDLSYELMPYSEADDIIKTHKLKKHLNLKAFTFLYGDLKIILYNDSNSYADKLFCVAHEIGHIYLEHSFYGILGCSKNSIQAATQEKEANEFAYQLLAPLCVLKKCRTRTLKRITHLTLLDGSYAEHILSELSNFKPSSLDNEMLGHYEDFIESNNYHLRKLVTDVVAVTMVVISGVCLVWLVVSTTPPPAPAQTFAPVPSVAVPLPLSPATPNPTVIFSPAPTSTVNCMVYITMSGTKYHRPDCYHIADSENLKEVTVENAQALDYEPCKSCRPDDK